MSRNLIKRFCVPCALMKAVRTADGEGGNTTVWTESTRFDGAFNKSRYNMRAMAERADDSVRAGRLTADGQCVIAFDPVQLIICYNDYVKRLTDGAIFRITSDPAETIAPVWMAIRFAQCSAERSELPV